MEPHCVVQPRWIEPLLERMAGSEDHATVVAPVIDVIPEADFSKYRASHSQVGGFDWTLTFRWAAFPEYRNASYRYPEPFASPAISGGIFGIWRDFWERLGEYDMGMSAWGGENIELSLRAWRCGGRIELLPCSRLGHVFRSAHPYSVSGKEVFRNHQRVAAVWLDEHAASFHAAAPWAEALDPGDVSERLRLRRALGCRSMGWYVEHVYPELLRSGARWVYWEFVHSKMVRARHDAVDFARGVLRRLGGLQEL